MPVSLPGGDVSDDVLEPDDLFLLDLVRKSNSKSRNSLSLIALNLAISSSSCLLFRSSASMRSESESPVCSGDGSEGLARQWTCAELRYIVQRGGNEISSTRTRTLSSRMAGFIRHCWLYTCNESPLVLVIQRYWSPREMKGVHWFFHGRQMKECLQTSDVYGS